jgi:hypothetical protein
MIYNVLRDLLISIIVIVIIILGEIKFHILQLRKYFNYGISQSGFGAFVAKQINLFQKLIAGLFLIYNKGLGCFSLVIPGLLK